MNEVLPEDGDDAPEPSLAGRLLAILDALPLAILEMDGSDLRITRANPMFCALVGRDREELVGTRSPFVWLASGQADVVQSLIDDQSSPSVRRRLTLRTVDDVEVATIAAATTLTSGRDAPTVLLVLEGLDGIERLLMPDIDRARLLLELANERDRIARDLHDRVVQRLFAVGIDLETAAELLASGADVRDRLWKSVEVIDEAMTEIRRTIFTLHRPGAAGAQPFEVLQSTVEAAGRLFGHDPELMVVGQLSGIPVEVLDEMTAVMRELLANVAKHASSSKCWVNVSVGAGWAAVRVEDDGNGFRHGDGDHGTGLRSLAERAALLGGSFSIGSRDPRGTEASWRVPIDVAS